MYYIAFGIHKILIHYSIVTKHFQNKKILCSWVYFQMGIYFYKASYKKLLLSYQQLFHIEISVVGNIKENPRTFLLCHYTVYYVNIMAL